MRIEIVKDHRYQTGKPRKSYRGFSRRTQNSSLVVHTNQKRTQKNTSRLRSRRHCSAWQNKTMAAKLFNYTDVVNDPKNENCGQRYLKRHLLKCATKGRSAALRLRERIVRTEIPRVDSAQRPFPQQLPFPVGRRPAEGSCHWPPLCSRCRAHRSMACRT